MGGFCVGEKSVDVCQLGMEEEPTVEATVVVPTAMHPTVVHVKYVEDGEAMKAQARLATADEHEVQNARRINDVCLAPRT